MHIYTWTYIYIYVCVSTCILWTYINIYTCQPANRQSFCNDSTYIHIIWYDPCMSLILQVFRTSWWARHYLAPTPKRHYCYANTPEIARLDRGKLTGWKATKKPEKYKTAQQYRDSKGILRYKGTAGLKRTETLDII